MGKLHLRGPLLCGALLLMLAACGGTPAGQQPAPSAAPTAAAAAPTSAPATAASAPTAAATSAPAAQPTAAPDTAPASQGAAVPVEIKLFQFKPQEIEVPVGTTVTWSNGDAIEHSVTGGSPPSAAGSFDSGFFTQGQSFSHTFSQAGDFPYFCMRHNSMVGVVHVK